MTGTILGLLTGLLKIGVQVAMAFVETIPLSIAWNSLAPIYLAKYIPQQFNHIPFMHIWGLLLIIQFIGECIQHVTPKVVNITQTNNEKKT